MLKELEYFKEMITLIPAMRQAVRTGLERDLNNHIHDSERIKLELKFLKQSFVLFRKKWTFDVIYVIRHLRPGYFNEIKKAIPGINSRSLTDRLRLLEKKKLINRKVHITQPYRVSYELTEYGNGAYELLLPLLYYFVLPEKYRK